MENEEYLLKKQQIAWDARARNNVCCLDCGSEESQAFLLIVFCTRILPDGLLDTASCRDTFLFEIAAFFYEYQPANRPAQSKMQVLVVIMSQQSLQTYMPSNTSDCAANIASKQNEQRIENHKQRMNLREKKHQKFRLLGDIYKETVILSAVVPDMHAPGASENNKRGKTKLHGNNLKKFRMLEDLYEDTEVLPSAISKNKTARACGYGQHRITEANPPSPKVYMAAVQLLEISHGVVHPKVASKTTVEYEIGNPICRVNRNPAEFRISTAEMFMRSV